MPRSFVGETTNGFVAVDLSPYKLVSFAFWLYWPSFTNNDALAMEYTPDANANAGFYIDPNAGGGDWTVTVSSGAALRTFHYTRPAAARWMHVAVAIDRTASPNIGLWLDGVFQNTSSGATGTLTTASTWANSYLYLMQRGAANTNLATAKMAHLAIWGHMNFTMPEPKFLALGASPLTLKEPLLLGYWPMDDYTILAPGYYPVSLNRASKRRSALSVAGDIVSTARLVSEPSGPMGGYIPAVPDFSTVLLNIDPNAISPGFIAPATVLFQPRTPQDVPIAFKAATTTLFAPSYLIEVDRVPPFIAPNTIVIPPKISGAITNLTLPQISGTPTAGLTLTASTGTWSGTPPFTFSYQWRRCNAGGASCVDIAGATNSQYIVQPADVGGTIRVVVTASDQ